MFVLQHFVLQYYGVTYLLVHVEQESSYSKTDRENSCKLNVKRSRYNKAKVNKVRLDVFS